jgi:GH15 family glucan-1,4-alpha-glucosidase
MLQEASLTETRVILETDLAPSQSSRLDYGMIGNGQTTALIGNDGGIDWCCMPTFESPSVFGRLLDWEKGGSFRITAVDGSPLRTQQQYLRNTNILETMLFGDNFTLRLLDFMPRWELGAGPKCYAPCEIYRIIEVVSGEPEIVIVFDPKPNYGRGETQLSALGPHQIVVMHGDEGFYLTTNLPSDAVLRGAPLQLTGPAFLAFSYNTPIQSPTLASAYDQLSWTATYWRRWVKHCYLPGNYQSTLIRSALTLKMMIYERTGAIIAAATTSIPEIVGGNRTWDYRFCWLRDSYFIINALLRLSQFEETEGFINYLKSLMSAEAADYLRPLYTIEGEVVPEEIFLDHWSGFCGSQPVRIGNSATTHYQNDVYGEMVLALYPLFMDERIVRRDLDRLWQMVQWLIDVAIEKFPELDNGIWEFRNYPRHYTFSKLMCWVALDRGVKIAYKLKKETIWRRWSKIRQAMKDEILEKAWSDELKAFTQAYGSHHLDASTLLMPALGIIDARDPRMLSTIQRSEELLMRNGMAFRYTNEDDFGRPENAFTICTFWMIDALILSGQRKKARRLFENILRHANPLGLFSEDLNPKTGQMTGNFPQGYTHVAIINTAMQLEEQL